MCIFHGWHYGETSGEYGDGGNDVQMDGECGGTMSKVGGNPFGRGEFGRRHTDQIGSKKIYIKGKRKACQKFM